MPQDEKLTREKLSELWRSDRVRVLDTKGKRYVIMSDIHLGDGGRADDLCKARCRNEEALVTALDHYNKEDYTLILLGDIEEFWQFDYSSIVQRYNDTVYERMRAFEDERFCRVWGNHDSEWGALADPARSEATKSGCAEEALKLRDGNGHPRILLLHGHQGSSESDRYSWSSRFWVRLYRFVEPIIKIDSHPSATRSQITKDYERILYTWAKNSKAMLICGHSHRAIFGSVSYAERLEREIENLKRGDLGETLDKSTRRHRIRKLKKELRRERERGRIIDSTEPDGEPLPCYFNTGCALYTDGITAIEIENDQIRLVKWHRMVPTTPQKVEFESDSLSEFLGQIARS